VRANPVEFVFDQERHEVSKEAPDNVAVIDDELTDLGDAIPPGGGAGRFGDYGFHGHVQVTLEKEGLIGGAPYPQDPCRAAGVPVVDETRHESFDAGIEVHPETGSNSRFEGGSCNGIVFDD
jgi:hypothetical protein